ncbi:MAG: ArsA-related P-loop ATPase [Myxococcota bacterium]
MSPRDLDAALREARVLVCAGTGGVGKTTISAALALEAALAGRRTLVLTIDPARRLADALGVDDLGSKPTHVDLSGLSPGTLGRTLPGCLDAMMLDPKPTFDALVARFAPDEAARQRILGNRIYRHLSEALAGSVDYAAMVQVHELIESGDYELIVVDTPPADHALDFLRAPRRMREFLHSRFVRSLLQPALSASRFGARLLGRGLQRILSLIERIAGGGFLDDISEFLKAIDGLSLAFDERSTWVEEFLLGPQTGFVLVCGGQARANTSALEFLSQLEAFRVPLVAVVANRLRPWPLAQPARDVDFSLSIPKVADDAQRLSVALEEPGAGEAIVARLSEYAQVCAAQNRALSDLEAAAAARDIECIRIRELPGDVDRLDKIAEIGAMLSNDPARNSSEPQP